MNDDLIMVLVIMLLVAIAVTAVVVGIITNNMHCIEDCIQVGNTTYYSFPVSIDGQQCKAITKYGDGSGMVALNCKGE